MTMMKTLLGKSFLYTVFANYANASYIATQSALHSPHAIAPRQS